MIKWTDINAHDKKEILNMLIFKQLLKEKRLSSNKKGDIIKTVKER